MKRSIALTTFVVLALATALAPRVCAQQVYTLTDIAPRTGSYNPGPVRINASGEIAGISATGYFRWIPSYANSPTGTFSLVPVPSGATGMTVGGLNNLGQLAGSAWKANSGHTFWNYVELWQPNGGTVNLASSGARAYALNDAGEAVGTTFGSTQTAFLCAGGKVYTLPGWCSLAVNASGQVATATFAGGGYLWTPSKPNGTTGTAVSLPLYPGGMNDLGQVVGAGGSNGNEVIYSGGTLLDLGVPCFDAFDYQGINNKSQVAFSHYLWVSALGLRDLSDPSQFTISGGAGWVIWSLNGINDYGQMVGWGENPSGQRRIFILTPQ